MVHSSDADDELVEVEIDEAERAERVEEAERNLQVWLSRKYWSAKEACYLFNGLEPDESSNEYLSADASYHYLYCLPESCAWREGDEGKISVAIPPRRNGAQIERDLKLTKRFVDLEDGPSDRRRPWEWLKLAAENGHRVPWLEFASSRPVLREYLPEGEEDRDGVIAEQRRTIDSLTAEVERLRAENKALSAIEGKSRISVLKIVGGMAITGWKLNLRNLEPDKFKDLLDDLDRVGAEVSPNTLRKYLREAAEYIEPTETAGG